MGCKPFVAACKMKNGYLLISQFYTGAAVARVTGKFAVVLRPTFRLEGSVKEPGSVTVMIVVASAMFGVVVLAVIVADPAAMGVTCTFTLV